MTDDRINTQWGYPDLRKALEMLPEDYASRGQVAVEFGVAAGVSTRLIADYLPVIGFDSWQGLPEDWREGYPKGAMACPKPEIDNATLVEGLFEDTLPGYDFSQHDIALVNVDCDLYSSTATALKHVGPHLKPGCLIVLDDYLEGDPHVYKAFWEACTQQGWSVEQHYECLFELKAIIDVPQIPSDEFPESEELPGMWEPADFIDNSDGAA